MASKAPRAAASNLAGTPEYQKLSTARCDTGMREEMKSQGGSASTGGVQVSEKDYYSGEDEELAALPVSNKLEKAKGCSPRSFGVVAPTTVVPREPRTESQRIQRPRRLTNRKAKGAAISLGRSNRRRAPTIQRGIADPL
jgi:hypothetical protein